MFRKKIIKALNFISAAADNLPLEDRLILNAIIIGALTSLLGSVTNLILATSIISGIIPLLLTVVLLLIYYFMRFKKIFKPFVVPIIVVSFIGISIIWIFNGGMNSSNT